MTVFAVMLLCGVWAGHVGSSRGGNGFGWFVAGFFLSLLGVILAYACNGRQCSACRKVIHSRAILCPHCQSRQTH